MKDSISQVKKPVIDLSPFHQSDIEQIVHWIPTPAFLLHSEYPVYHYSMDRDYFESKTSRANMGDSKILLFKAIDSKTGNIIGYGELDRIDNKNLSAEITGILVGPMEPKGLKLEEEIIRSLIRVGFKLLSLHRLYVRVFDFNKTAIRRYTNLGFKKEGILRDAYRHNDDYWDLVLMSLINGQE